ncbi:methyltransferase, FxLD system [Parafrankia discariae]|uniref:methyltransferase, FxLD system n=1 Tax=Parafrankia discariae TaxID=365528 RepID=UPI0003818186|nr:methyltransferase, FxLD system [Parafrankia discariae]
MTLPTRDSSPDALHAAMVRRLARSGNVLTDAVAEAMAAVPRHLFLPDTPPRMAYSEQDIITKRVTADGPALSWASAPGTIATTLEQLIVLPGQNVLEVGTGTGYTTALLAHLTGMGGHVTTLDIDPDITAAARDVLTATGHTTITALTGDGRHGHPDAAPYQRIVAAGTWDIPAAWWDQLARGGRLVVPLRLRGASYSIGFAHRGDRMVSDTIEPTGLTPMISGEGERTASIHQDTLVCLVWDHDQPISSAALSGVLHRDRAVAVSGVTLGRNTPVDGIWLRLAATEAGCCRITARGPAVTSQLCTPAIPSGSPALVEEDSLAYLTLTRERYGYAHVLGAIGHGPKRHQLTDRIIAAIHAWDRDRTAAPTITLHRGTPNTTRTRIITKGENRLTITP